MATVSVGPDLGLEVWRVLTVVGGEPGVPGVGEGPPVLATQAGQGLRPSLPQH